MSLRTEKDEIETQREEKVFSVLEPRVVKLTNRTEVNVRRTLPHKQLRMIGAWCFIDHYGPTHQVTGMTIGAHPHMGLQTVTWLFEGTILHSDSLGTTQEISPSQLNLMTAGRGIAHSEQSLEQGCSMHGVQLWIALPDNSRHCAPIFEHFSQLPSATQDGTTATVFIGTYGELTSKAKIYSDLVGAEFSSDAGTFELALNPLFEYGILNVGDTFAIKGEDVKFGELAYVPVVRRQSQLIPLPTNTGYCWEEFLSQKRFLCGGTSSLAHMKKLSKRAKVGTLMILLSPIFLMTLIREFRHQNCQISD